MAKKRRVKISRRVKQNSIPKFSEETSHRRIKIALKNLILFAIISVVMFILYTVSTNLILANFFWVMAWAMFCVAVAFLIAFLVFKTLAYARKR